MVRVGVLAAISLAIISPVSAAEPDGPSSLITRLEAARILLEEHLFSAGKGSRIGEQKALIEFYSKPDQQLLWVDEDGTNERGKAVIEEISKADSYGLRASTYGLSKIGAIPTDQPGIDWLATTESKISLAVLSYSRDARGGRLDPSRLSENLDPSLSIANPLEVLETIAIRSDPAAYLRSFEPHQAQFEALRDKLSESQGKAGNGGNGQRILLNMERWRWLPDNLGSLYVMVNVPEFTLRVVEDGKVIHTARVVVGKPDKQTPIFSQDMQEIVFNPYWNVPNSIKTEELLPYLAQGGGLFGGDTSILERHNLHVNYGGHEVNPASLDWGGIDIRSVEIFQPPGGDNPLGRVKFVFPNKHDVYMHDTTQKNFFAQSIRAESHGCMRVQNPEQLAALLLKRDQNWSQERVAAALANGYDQHVKLERRIPVYITYFTAWVNADGSMSTFGDVYGHDARMARALLGGSIEPSAERDQLVTQHVQSANRRPHQRNNFNNDFARAFFNF